ncbi:MAG: hypothetical protein WA908_01575 [Pontixanthobacter sp.]
MGAKPAPKVVDLDTLKATAEMADWAQVSSDYLMQVHAELSAHRKAAAEKGHAFGLSAGRQL